jgi:hypothetical protein
VQESRHPLKQKTLEWGTQAGYYAQNMFTPMELDDAEYRMTTRTGYLCPDNAFTLVDGRPANADGYQGVVNGRIFTFARQLSSKPLGWSRKFAMIVAKQIRSQRDWLCPLPGNTRFVEFFSVIAALAA